MIIVDTLRYLGSGSISASMYSNGRIPVIKNISRTVKVHVDNIGATENIKIEEKPAFFSNLQNFRLQNSKLKEM